MGNCGSGQKNFQVNKSFKFNKFNKFNKEISVASQFYHQNSQLIITFLTWPGAILPNVRDESRVKQKSFKINQNALITYQNEQNNQFVCKQDNPDFNKINFQTKKTDQSKTNLAIQKRSKGFEVQFHQQEHVYELVIGSCQIIQNDCFLIGGTEFKFVKFIKDRNLIKQRIQNISKFQIQSQKQSSNEIKSLAFIQSFKMLSNGPQNNQQKTVCRICTGQQLTPDNPLISPCDCTGSIQYYHLNCWSEWACKSQQITKDMYLGHVIRQSCEICKKSLVQNQSYRSNMAAILSSAHKITSPFIVLEGKHSLHNFPYYRNLKLNYIIYSFANKKQFTIGRSRKMEVKTKLDDAISSQNSVIQLKDGNIYLTDLKSKHGTYLKVRQSVIINDNHPRYFLFKNNLIELKLQ